MRRVHDPLVCGGLDFEVPFYVDGQVKVRSFNTVTGPADGKRLLTGLRLVPSGAENVYIGIDRSTVWRVNANGESVNESATKHDLADWSMGVTYDSQAQRVVLVTLGGEGFLYQRDAASGEWSTIASMANEDLESLAYRAEDNSFYGIEVYNGAPEMPATLLKYSAAGEKVGEIQLPAFPVNLSPGAHTAKLVAVEGKIVALIESNPQNPMSAGDHSRIYVIDPAIGSAELTFDNEPGHAPTVEFLAPDNESVITVNQSVTLQIQAADPDNDLRFIILREEPAELRMWSLDPSPVGNHTETFTYTPRTIGTHTIQVFVNDLSGRMAEATLTLVATDAPPPPPPPAEGITFQVPFLIDGQVKMRVFNTVTGPEDGQRLFTGHRLVPSGQDNVFIGINWHTVFRVIGDSGSETEHAEGFDLHDWPMGVAHDSLANRTVLVTLGGQGALYQRNSAGEWSTLASMENEDLESLVYLRADNSFYGLEVYRGAPGLPATFAHYSADGSPLQDITLPPFPVNLSPGDHETELVAAGEKIIALVEQNSGLPMQPGNRSRIYVIDPVAGTSELTYESEPEQPPTVRFQQPASNVTIDLGGTVNIVLEVSDPDNDLRSVELWDGSTTLLNRWTFDSGGAQPQTLTFLWTPTRPANRPVFARATDARGNTTEAIVRVTVLDPTVSFVGWYFKDDQVIGVDYLEDGPLDGGTLYRGLPVAQAGFRYLGRDGHVIFHWDNEHDQYTETSPGGDFSWPRGTAYDSKRNRFIVVTLVSEGALYAVTPATLEWTTIASMENVDADSIVYHPADDHLYMVENHGGTVRILRYDSEGNPSGQTISIADVPLEIGSYYQSRLISARNKIALLIEPTPGWRPNPPVESRIYIIDPATGASELTCRKIWETWPPRPQPEPTIAITAPANNAQFTQDKILGINMRGDVAFENVSIFSNGQKIGDASESPLTVFPPHYNFTWINPPVGEHQLVAVGQTATSSATSPPVNIRILAVTENVVVERKLPEHYAIGTALVVQLTADPSFGVNAWALEEEPPSGWAISQVSAGGISDKASGKIKWGPFTDAGSRGFYYTVVPLGSTGLKTFSGIVSVNGVSNPIGGDTTISDESRFHPADAPTQDSRLTVDEVTAYAAAWKSGAQWPRPPGTIPISYVTRAGHIWKSGEQYQYVGTLAPPMCWAPPTPELRHAGMLAASPGASEATRSSLSAISPGRVATVSVTARPAAGVQSYAVEERPPAGWTIADAQGGSIVNGSVRFGPYLDAQTRTFTYQIIPTSAAGEFAGSASFDGSNDPIKGACAVSGPACAEHRDGRVHLRFSVTPSESYVLESAGSVDSATWQHEATVEGGQSAIELPPIEPSEKSKFYRLRSLAQ